MSSVLIIDDDEDQAKGIGSFLKKKCGASIEIKENAQDALLIIKDRLTSLDPFDLILIDVQLPKSNVEKDIDFKAGLRILSALKRSIYPLDGNETNIIVYTGVPDYNDCVSCIKSGALDYIQKGGDGKLEEAARNVLQYHPNPMDSWFHQNRELLVTAYGEGVEVVVIEREFFDDLLGDVEAHIHEEFGCCERTDLYKNLADEDRFNYYCVYKKKRYKL